MEIDDQQECDDLDAMYAQQQNEERRQWEERILARGQRIHEEFQHEVKEWLEKAYRT